MELNTSQIVPLQIAGYYDGNCGYDAATGKLAFLTSSIRYGQVDALLDGQPVRLLLDKSRYHRTTHPFIHATIL